MSVYAGPEITTSGLIFHVDAANSKSYPGSGNTWIDLSGNNNNGTLINGPSYNIANGGIITFDGSDDSCNTGLSGPTTFTSNSDFSISCWANFSAYKPAASSIGTLVGAFNYQGYGLFWVGTPTTYVVGSYMRYAGVTSDIRSSNITPGVWFHAVQSYSRSGNFNRLYINGTLSNSGTSISGAFNSNLDNMFIAIANGIPGKNDGTPGGGVGGTPFLGNIASVSIYNRALSAAEIFQNFNANRSRFGL